MYKVIIHSRAEQDLMDIFLYITEYLKAPDTAQHLYSKIKQQISTLESMPYRCSLVSDEPYKQLGIRKQFVDNYIIFFVTETKNLQGIYFVHLSQDQLTDCQGLVCQFFIYGI